jgi:copper chaperone CopZ
LYGDHHVALVRRILESLPGVTEISLSPAAHTATFQFDSAQQTKEAIETALASAGYQTGDPERALPSAGGAAPRTTGLPAGTMSFTHEAPAWEGRPLWPCPGFERTPVPDN